MLNRLPVFLLLATIVSGRTAEPARPHLLGIAHMALFVSDLGKARTFDPDGTRIELMEPNTADGKPVPPSAAPAPK